MLAPFRMGVIAAAIRGLLGVTGPVDVVLGKAGASLFAYSTYDGGFYESVTDGATFARLGSFAYNTSLASPTLRAFRSDGVYVIPLSDFSGSGFGATTSVLRGTSGTVPSIIAHTFASDEKPRAIGTDGTKFVIITVGKKIYSSTDGTTWTLTGTSTDSALDGTGGLGQLNYVGGRWFLRNASSFYYTTDSTLLSGWTACSMPSTNFPQHTVIASFSGALYMAGLRPAGIVNEGVIMKSTDSGSTWTNALAPIAPGVWDVFVMGSNLVALQGLPDFSPATKGIQSSSDGSTWTFTSGSVQLFAWPIQSGTNIVARVYDATAGTYRLQYSADGISWTNSSIISSAVAPTADPYFDKVSLLLHGEGANASTTFTDSSPTPKTVSVFGNAQISTAQSKFGSASIALDGTGDYLSVASDAAFGFGTGDFTIEYWTMPTRNTINETFIDTRPSDTGTPLVLGKSSAGAVRCYDGTTVRTGGTMTLNAWNHVAWCRVGAANTIYLNGVAVISFSNAFDAGSARGLTIGSNVLTSAENCAGYFDDLRITKGLARYTADFQPPKQAHFDTWEDANISSVVLLLHGDGANASTAIYDDSATPKTVTVVGNAQISTTQSKFGGTSIAFDGTGDYLTVPTSSGDFSFGTGDFTVEMWVYLTSVAPTYQGLFEARTAGVQVVPCFGFNLAKLLWYVNGAIVIQSGDLAVNTWHHVSVCRSAGTTKMFVGGVQVGASYTDANNYTANQAMIGSFFDGFSLNGYIDDLRITKGVARYTAAFTPPPLEFPNKAANAYSSSVVLLLHGDGANASTTFTDSASLPKTVTAVGNAQISTAQSKFGGSSMLFDGAGDYLTIPSSTDFDFGSGDFTVEMWVKTTQTTSYAALIGREWGSSPYSGGWSLFLNGSTSVVNLWVADYSQAAPLVACSAGANDGAWHHLAWVRSGNVHTIYKDGVSIGTGTSSTSFATVSKNITIGNDLTFGSGGRAFNGNIDDLRITKGVAVYTANFSPPTQALPNPTPKDPNFASVSLLLHGEGNNGSTTITDSSASAKAITVVGDTKLSVGQSKYGGTAILFDGAGDYITAPTGTDFNFGTGDFTVEGFVYFNSTTGNQVLFDGLPIGGDGARSSTFVLIATAGVLKIFSNGSFSANSSVSIPATTWTHFAVVRTSGTLKIFVGGSEGLSFGFGTNLSTGGCTIGRLGDSADYYLNGYLDEMRITKGVARYTAAFTPPAPPFPDA